MVLPRSTSLNNSGREKPKTKLEKACTPLCVPVVHRSEVGGRCLLPTLSTLLSLSSSLRWPHHTDQAGLGLAEIRLPLPQPSKSFDSRCVVLHPVLLCVMVT